MSRIVYLHGFASGPGSKKAQFFHGRFAELGIEMEIPDLAEGDFEHLTITRQLKVIERECKDQRVCLMGSSMGGYLAALYAARHEVERLVLLAPAFSFVTRWPETLGSDKLEEWKRSGVLGVYHYGDKCERKLSHDLLDDARFYEDYPNFHQPALIFHGKNDAVVPPGYSITFSQQHANTKLRLLDSGHELVDVLDIMWADVKEFLAPQLKAGGGG